MEGACCFPNCPFSGGIRELYNHCAVWHPQFILTLNDENAFNITFSDFLKETFLLVSNGGLYWLLLDSVTTSGYVRRGIFPIGKSEICEYTTKVGQTGDTCISYVGPCQMESRSSPKYDLECSIPQIIENAQPSTIQIFFGPYTDCDVVMDEDISAEEMEVIDENSNDLEDTSKDLEELLKAIEENSKDFDDDLANNNFKCLVCYDEDWSKSTCPICRPDMSLDIIDPFDEEQLIQSLTQFSEITQMMQMAA